MKLSVNRAEVWVATIEDRAGGTAGKLEALARAGANVEFVLARRTPEEPGKGVLFLCPVKGAKVIRAAREAGFAKLGSIHSVRIEGTDMPGLGARISRTLSNAGISFRGLSAAAIGRKFVSYVSLDSAADAAKASGLLKKMS